MIPCSQSTTNTPIPFTMTTTFPNAVSAEVSIALGTHGECETYSIGCSSTANAVGRAYDLIRSHDVDLVIAGGAEAPLHPTIFSAMDAGRTLPPTRAERYAIFLAHSIRRGAESCSEKGPDA